MKNSKLLLLGGIFTLVGIFNYSSAQFVAEDTFACSSNSDMSSSIYNSDVSFSKIGGAHTSCQFLYYNQAGVQVKTWNDSCNKSFTIPFDIAGDSIYGVKVKCDYDDTILKISYNSDKMPVSTLSPVIDGLTNSINEFIPYVVFIGLGVLGAIVGFFAIKRLLRFVKGSSLSVFSSRRKKK